MQLSHSLIAWHSLNSSWLKPKISNRCTLPSEVVRVFTVGWQSQNMEGRVSSDTVRLATDRHGLETSEQATWKNGKLTHTHTRTKTNTHTHTHGCAHALTLKKKFFKTSSAQTETRLRLWDGVPKNIRCCKIPWGHQKISLLCGLSQDRPTSTTHFCLSLKFPVPK